MQIGVVESEQSGEARIAGRVHDRLSSVGLLWLDTVLKGPRRFLRACQNLNLPDALEFRLKLRRLQKEKARLYGVYAARQQECRRLNADDERIEQLKYLEHDEIGIIDEQIYQFYFERITAQAERSFISIPDLQESREDWETARLTGRWRLRTPVFTGSNGGHTQREKRPAGSAPGEADLDHFSYRHVWGTDRFDLRPCSMRRWPLFGSHRAIV